MNGQQGVQVTRPYYKITVGVPAAVVRSYKQPLYDSDLVRQAAPNAEIILYQRPIGQNLSDGTTQKTLLHTNMRSAGTLGVPLSFDLFGFNLRIAKTVVVAEFRNIFGTAVFEYSVGQDTIFLQVPAEDVPAGVDTEGLAATDFPHIGWGTSENYYRFDVTGRALHINSRLGCTARRLAVKNPNNGGHLARRDYHRGGNASFATARESDKGVSCKHEMKMRSDLRGDTERSAEMTDLALERALITRMQENFQVFPKGNCPSARQRAMRSANNGQSPTGHETVAATRKLFFATARETDKRHPTRVNIQSSPCGYMKARKVEGCSSRVQGTRLRRIDCSASGPIEACGPSRGNSC